MTLLIHTFELATGPALALYAIATFVGFTRTYVGAHYPRDVIGGVILGSAWGIVAVLVDHYWVALRF